MDALNNVEQSYQKLLRAQTNSKQESTSTKTNSSLSVSVSFLFCVCPIILNVLLKVQFKSTQLLTNYFHGNCLNLHCDTFSFWLSLLRTGFNSPTVFENMSQQTFENDIDFIRLQINLNIFIESALNYFQIHRRDLSWKLR